MNKSKDVASIDDCGRAHFAIGINPMVSFNYLLKCLVVNRPRSVSRSTVDPGAFTFVDCFTFVSYLTSQEIFERGFS